MAEGTFTCVDRVRLHLDTITANHHLNAFLTVYGEEALSRAATIDKKIAEGKAGRLAGLVLGIKDVFAYTDHPLNAASKILGDFKSQYTATALQRALDDDAIIIGRQNCDEFGMGSSTENSSFGPVLNPIDLTRSPGGSSGGSAAAVAANLCQVSLGSDTGGSVRQPAAFCGLFGLKPTYGRISRFGLTAYASSFDTVGILSNDLDDMASVLHSIAGKDEHDSTVSSQPVPDYVANLAESPTFKVAVIRDTLESPALQEEVRESVNAAVAELKSKGHSVDTVQFPLLDYVLPTYYILAAAEASSNLSRYDGVRYGYRNQDSENIESLYKKTRSIGFGKEVQRRILLGTFVLTSDYHDTYYSKAQKVRRLIREKTIELLKKYDILLLPTTPTTAFQLGEQKNPLALYMADLFSVQANVAGVPAISFPHGKDRQGLPIGLQAMAGDFGESKLLQFARLFKVDP